MRFYLNPRVLIEWFVQRASLAAGEIFNPRLGRNAIERNFGVLWAEAMLEYAFVMGNERKVKILKLQDEAILNGDDGIRMLLETIAWCE